MKISPAYFEAMFKGNDDPWSFRSRWYEARKRALTLASLPAQKYATAYEPGCANGELSAELASRCDRLLISDGTPRAVEVARDRLQAMPHVEVIEAWLPEQWPSRKFDLIVFSELGYFLTCQDLNKVISKMRQSLSANGTVLACHWRRPIEGCVMTGDDVHACLQESLQLARLVHTADTDFLLDVWCANPESTAQQEQIP